MKKLILIILFLVNLIAYDDFYSVLSEPKQVKTKEKIIKINGYKLKTLYKFKIKGRIVSAKKYSWDDISGVATHDFGIVWGRLSKSNIYQKFTWNQKKRFLIFKVGKSDVNKIGGIDYIESHIANIHLIPRTKKIESILNTVKPNDIIEIKGLLVDIYFKNKVVYTSVRRDDKGPGACEIILVYEVKLQRSTKEFLKKSKVLIDDSKLNFKTPGEKTRIREKIMKH